MSLNTVPQGVADASLISAVKELQGLTVTVVAGAAAGTAMAVPALRTTDTLLTALVSTDAGGAMADDVANMTIQSTTASGTVTVSGNPPADSTVTVNGVAYTFKVAPSDAKHVLITTGDTTAMAASLAAAVNEYEGRYVEPGGYAVPTVVATSAAGVVTISAKAEGTGGNALTLAKSGTNLAVSGATLAGGAAAGGVKSTTTLTGKTVTLFWFNKA